MTTYQIFQCDLCIKNISKGFTLVYRPGDGTEYNLSSVKYGLQTESKTQSETGGMIKHLCVKCGDDIYTECKKVLKEIK